VASPDHMPPELLREMYLVGNRPHHYRAFLDLLRNGASWEDATMIYKQIAVPVLLVWGEQDWAKSSERDRDRGLLPAAETVTIDDAGHFLPLDRPGELNELIIRFVATGSRAVAR